jgi:arylformamidase
MRIGVTRMRTLLGATASLVVAAAVGATALGASPDACSPTKPETVAYEHLSGVPVNATSLDIYAPKVSCRATNRKAPVVMWVHGGGYQRGDKSNKVTDKRRLFNGRGWFFISVNYRLTKTGDPTSAHYPDHYRDVAAAVAWTRSHIGSRGGDSQRVALLGHSAGADIVSNVATNPKWLTQRDLGLRAVRCSGPLDTEGFDKTRVPNRSDEAAQWREALGNDPNYRRDTSATLLAKANTGIPKTITVKRGTALRQSIEVDFANRLRSIGVPATVIDARTLSHEEVNTRIGAPGDKVMTPPLMKFLTGCFAS